MRNNDHMICINYGQQKMFQYLRPVAGIPSRTWVMIARDSD